MTQSESYNIEVGHTVVYLGKKVLVDGIFNIGTEYHPYFKLVPIDKVTKAQLKMITKGHVGYALCDLPKGSS